MSPLVQADGIHVGYMHFEAGGRVGYHPASTHQLFAVVAGEGWVRAGEANRVALRAGQAAFWEPGEYHEAGTDTGMTVIVVEGNALGSRSAHTASDTDRR
jgi:quercetin dioxygenase-like cupin family protein